jgi:hypothetical protein
MVNYGGGGDTAAAKLGLAAAPFPIEMLNNVTVALTGGFLICALVRPIKSLVTNLGLILTAASITPNGVNAMGLYDEASGLLLGRTGDLSTAWSTAGNDGLYVEAAITGGPLAVSTSKNYYVAALSHNVTDPEIAVFFAGAGVAYPSVKGHKPVLAISGQADLPASITPASAAVGNAGYWMAGS